MGPLRRGVNVGGGMIAGWAWKRQRGLSLVVTAGFWRLR
jgi:hypothetical protein